MHRRHRGRRAQPRDRAGPGVQRPRGGRSHRRRAPRAETTPTAAFASAILFGGAHTATVGVQAIASAELFSDRPSLGLSAVMGANGLGLLIGPAAAGARTSLLGLQTVLLLGAAVPLAAAAVESLQAGAAPRAGLVPG